MRETLASTGPSVTDILTERSREAEGLSRMVLYSLFAHVVLVAALALIPGGWFGSEEPRERVVDVDLAEWIAGPRHRRQESDCGQSRAASGRRSEASPLQRRPRQSRLRW